MGGSPKVMLVDDDESLCRTLGLVLDRKGYDVTVVHNGEDAVGKVKEEPFDLIFMDIRMPGIDGVEAFDRIRKIRPDAPVMMMTAYTVEEQVQRALYMGAEGVLYKPVDLGKVISAVEAISKKPAGSKILVVDDDPGTAVTLKNILVRKGHEVNTAGSGHEAVRMAQELYPEIALIDMKLPDINGLETYLEMKKTNPDLTAVMITGYREEMAALLETALKASAYTVLYKPLDMGALLTIVTELSEKKVK
jgi:two-component system response regulator HydG